MKPIFKQNPRGFGTGHTICRADVDGKGLRPYYYNDCPESFPHEDTYCALMNRKYRLHLRVELALICALSIGLSFIVGLIFGV